MKKFVYTNKINGAKVYSDKPLNNPNLRLVVGVKSGQITNNDNKVIKK